MVILATVALLVLLLVIGLPVALSLGISGLVGMYWVSGWDGVYSLLYTVPFRTAASYTLSVVPMFILMAQAVSASGLVADVFVAMRRWLERLPGGMAVAAVFSSAILAAMSGSSLASTATMSSIAVPEMMRNGYRPHVATGVVAVAGTLAIMIPPSVGLVIYAIITENPIGRMLIAGVVPGILSALMFIVGIMIWKKLEPKAMPDVSSKYTWAQRFASLKPLWAFLLLSFSVLGSIYLGWATPTEAASVGALGAIVIPLFQRRFRLKDVVPAVIRTLEISTMIFTIIIGAMLFGYFLTMSRGTQQIIGFVGGLNVPPWTVLAIFLLILLALGMLLDQLSIVLITLPLIYPVVMDLGYDPIWFGIIMVKMAEIGLITPPVGMNAFVVNASTGVPLSDVFRGLSVMLIFEVITLILLLAFPVLSTWLPSMMF